MQYWRLILFPFGIIYWMATGFRNMLYNIGVHKSTPFSIPIINVGNLSIGGTGKSPHVEYLIRLLKEDNNLATLSRGYGRREFGFKIADEKSTALSIGDEPMQYHTKFGNEIIVAVEANRVHGVMDICRERPETNLVLLDDAYQHRAIKPGLNILLTTYDKPFYNDWILPVGDLRESRAGKRRADIIVVTKCPEITDHEKVRITKKLLGNKQKHVFFSSIKYGKVRALQNRNDEIDLKGRKVILVTGIASAKKLIDQVKKDSVILEHVNYPDHHKFRAEDIQKVHNIFGKFANENPIILTTEKDAMRLINPEFSYEIQDKPWYFQEIEMEIEDKEKFDQLILAYVKENN